VLEHHDFTKPQKLPELVSKYLRLHAFEPHWQDILCQGLQAALDTPLGPEADDLRLSQLRWSPRERLDELDFDLPVLGGSQCSTAGTIGGPELAQVLAHHAEGCPLLGSETLKRIAELPGRPLRGYLTGQIDLVFRREGHKKWFVVDYKSNWLGDPRTGRCESDHYRQERLNKAMDHSLYVLQYHLYTVALHRYLRWRLPDYDYDQHMGGSLYLFLRGMTGELSARGPGGHPTGVFFDRPPRERIEALDQLLATGSL
jgi:exodeoxyribonuclease V beta subunit